MATESGRLRKTAYSSFGLPLVELAHFAPMLVVLSHNESLSNSGRAVSVYCECDVICLWSLHTI